jgi:hypothetical protein
VAILQVIEGGGYVAKETDQLTRRHKNPPRARILPDALFNILWNKSLDYTNAHEFSSVVLADMSPKLSRFIQSYRIPTDDVMEMLEGIHSASHMLFPDILSKSSKRPSEIRDIFCIPIRTIEDWKSCKKPCPAYIRLMLIRHFYLLDLGRQMYLQSDMERQLLRPRVYTKHAASEDDATNKETVISPSFETSTGDEGLDEMLAGIHVTRSAHELEEFRERYTRHMQAMSDSMDDIMGEIFENNKHMFAKAHSPGK